MGAVPTQGMWRVRRVPSVSLGVGGPCVGTTECPLCDGTTELVRAHGRMGGVDSRCVGLSPLDLMRCWGAPTQM